MLADGSTLPPATGSLFSLASGSTSAFATGSTLLLGAGALLVVLGLIWILARGARVAGLAQGGGRNKRLAVQESVALDTRRRVTLVRVDGRDVLLLTGGPQDTVVGWLP